jgi:hypothetical protein
MDGSGRPAYRVPQYRAPDDAAFYHFLHGTVPGHQIDYMYCPEVPQGALAQTHFGHLTRLIRYIEPRQGAPYGFALGNLSRDDVQHEPGHGGVAIMFALRVPGVTDHAGRDMPPYAHCIVAVDRHLEYVQLVEAMIRLYRRFLEREDADHQRGEFYRTYAAIMQQEPEAAAAFLGNTIAEIADIPRPPRSALGFDFELDPEAPPPPARIYVIHGDGETFSTLAHFAAIMGAALYRSNVKWTSITTGREIEISGGTSLRFVPESEAHTVSGGPIHRLDDLPDDEAELIRLLFGARRRVEQVTARHQGWREKLAAQRPGRSERPAAAGGPPSDSQDSGEIDVEIDDAAATLVAGFEHEAGPGSGALPRRPSARPEPWAPPGGGFDPRRSSPVTGVAAALAPPPVARFDPRGSSPVTGVAAATLPLPARPGGAMPLPSPPSAVQHHVPPPPSLPSAPTHLERSASAASRTPRSRLIIAAAAFAAITVIIIVSVVAGMNLQEAEPGSGSTGAGQPE